MGDPQSPKAGSDPRALLTGRTKTGPRLSPALQALLPELAPAVSHAKTPAPAPEPTFTRRASGKTGGGVQTTATEARAAAKRQDESYAAKLLASPVTGTARAYKGLRTIGGQLPPFAPAPDPKELARGATDVLGGGMEASTVLLPEAVAAKPVQMLGGLAAGTGIGTGVTALGEHLGVPKEYTDLAADTLGLAGGAAVGHSLTPEAQTAIVGEAKRLYTDESGTLDLGKLAEITRRLFPKLDAWGKPAGRLTEKSIRARVEVAEAPREVKRALRRIATQIGERRVAPQELHALAAGEDYVPDRVIRRVTAPVEGAEPRKGAPYGVTNARQERGLRERYLRSIGLGASGRDWYTDAGEAIKFYANDDPARANLVAEDLAITSPVTEVSGNTGMGVKGYNQATAGVPVVTGRFPTAMGKAIEAAHAAGTGSAIGLKRTPFAQNLARGGGFLLSSDPPRAVHDIWDAEAHGFMNPDGTPMRAGFGPAQHRWMDAQQDKILATANERGVGGFTDWDELKSQASAWTGQQIEAGRLDPADAAKSYADYFQQLVAQGSRETMPGRTTGHLPELFEPGMEAFRQQLHEIMMRESGIYDPQMRDQIAAGFGGLVGRAFEGPGLYQGEISPGMQTQVLTGSLEVPGGPTGARMLDEGSRRILNAAEATHGLALGQDASAWSRLLPAGSRAPRGLWDVTLPGGTLTPEQMKALAMRFPNIGDMAVIPTPEGVRLGFMDPATMKSITTMLGGKVKEAGAGLETELASKLLPNDWEIQRVGQGYFDPIRTMGTEKFDAFAPAMFERIRKADALFRAETNGRFTMSQMLDEVRGAVAGEGFAGLERLAKKYGIPVTLLALGLHTLGLHSPAPAAEGPG